MSNENLINEVYNYWKEKGFPKYPTDRKWRDNVFQQLVLELIKYEHMNNSLWPPGICL